MTVTVAEPSARRRWAGLVVLSASVLIVVMDMTVLNVALPAISEALLPGSIQLLWIVDVYALVLAGLLVTAGAVGDRWGRKRMLLSGFAVFGAASAAVLLTGGAIELIALRALLGVGGAMIMPSTLSLIRTLFTDPRERATALGVWSAMAAVGAALGPILGGALLEMFSWQAAFLVNVPIMAAALVAGLFLLPESRHPRPGAWDATATVLSIVGMASLVYGIKQVGAYGLDDLRGPAAGVVAVVTLGWFAVRCLRRPDPLLELRLFESRPFTAGVVTALATSIAMAATLLLLAQWLQLVEGLSPLETGVRLLPAAVAAVVASPLAPRLAARTGSRVVLAGGLAVSGLGFLVLLGVPPLAGGGMAGWVVVAALALIGAGQGSLAVASAAIMSGSPAAKAGSAAAIEETSYEIGGALGVAILGSVAAAVYRTGLGYGGPSAQAAAESLGGALAVAAELGQAGLRLAEQAKAAFTAALALTSAAGGVLMLLAGLGVWLLLSRDVDVSRHP